MANKNPSMKATLKAIKSKACTWYDRCSFLYETREGMDALNGGITFNITCTILVDGFDMNYRLRFNYRQRPGEGFNYVVSSNFGEVRCNKTTNDFDRAMAFVDMLMKDGCARITGRDEERPANWKVPREESADFHALAEDDCGYSESA